MSQTVLRIDARSQRTEPTDAAATVEAPRRRVDVSSLHLDEIQTYVDANLETDRVSLERRGSRTFLLVER
ncbi:hypothetical protein QA600_16640 [Natronococcus sp. A-GB1]|uniref:Uncharacterized protein n=1 Tax=Natronococcus amylolyticus DSM 10524 TaxID=1227497 RepID=L9X5P6_9EURY|nr:MULTISPECIES: hypothetical protein [Natronococcus]ELY56786.1 hypothetical protein C491_12305 [Natronococcus amylolyticus DSM 10524]MDG5760961.1 hypothetical protein [Natronococcus sp. A-GB1]